MTDGSAAGALGGAGSDQGAAGASGGGEPGAGTPADGSAAGANGTPPSVPAWMETLPADSPLRQNQDLLRMASIEDVAKGYTETRAWAKGRIAIPADEAGWTELGQKLRPESPEGYNITVPDGQDPTLAHSFRQFAYDQGIPARYADATAQFFNQQTEASLSKLASDNQQSIAALELEYGPAAYAQRIEATNKMLAAAGLDVDVADTLAQIVGKGPDGKPVAGAGAALKALFTLAEKTGELGKVDSIDVGLRLGQVTGEQAKAEIDRLSGDQSPEGRKWMAQAKIPGTPENRRWNELNEAQARWQAGQKGA